MRCHFISRGITQLRTACRTGVVYCKQPNFYCPSKTSECTNSTETHTNTHTHTHTHTHTQTGTELLTQQYITDGHITNQPSNVDIINLNEASNQQDAKTFRLLIFLNQPYMFRATNSPILRNTFDCIHSSWYNAPTMLPTGATVKMERRWARTACSFRSAQAATLLEFMYHSRIVLSVGCSVWYMFRNLRCPITIHSDLANSKTQNAFLFTVNAIFIHDYPLTVETGSTPRPLVQKKTWSNSLPIDMLLSAVSVLVGAQSSSEIPGGPMNKHVYGENK